LAETQKDLVAERKRVKAMMEASEEECEQLLKELYLAPNTKLYEIDRLAHNRPEWASRLMKIRSAMINTVNFDKQQLGSKIVQNALYGFLGAQMNALLACVVLMAVVTAIGRWQIKLSAWYAIRTMKAAVIYGDTDSIMLQIPGVAPGEGAKLEDWNEEYFKHFRNLAKEISDLFPSPQKLNMEDLSVRSLFFAQKKNYVKKVYEKPNVFKKLKISGLGFMKRDRCAWACTTCTKVAKMLIEGEAKEVSEYLRAEFKRLSSGSIPLTNLAVSISLKDKNAYKGSSDLIQLKLADKIHIRSGVYPQPGSRLTYIIVENKKAKNISDTGELLEWALANKAVVDLHHYIRQIRPLLELLCIHHSEIPLQKLLKECEQNIQQSKAVRMGSVLSFFKPAIKPVDAGSAKEEAVDELDVEFEDDDV
jgi:DNA polymerase elongation subunit (family B)